MHVTEEDTGPRDGGSSGSRPGGRRKGQTAPATGPRSRTCRCHSAAPRPPASYLGPCGVWDTKPTLSLLLQVPDVNNGWVTASLCLYNKNLNHSFPCLLAYPSQ